MCIHWYQTFREWYHTGLEYRLHGELATKTISQTMFERRRVSEGEQEEKQSFASRDDDSPR